MRENTIHELEDKIRRLASMRMSYGTEAGICYEDLEKDILNDVARCRIDPRRELDPFVLTLFHRYVA